ncbi:MAG: AAA family ATPase [Candidatus Fermentibacteria bacterium]|nr:AAA family ATPase [Candidatus Fermentibacteria bacterium]
MIVNFSVRNYKSIKDEITLSFEASKSEDMEKHYVIRSVKNMRLLKLGIIYGANASGKTTILEALDFLKNIVINPFHKKTSKFDFEPFLFNDVSRGENTVFTLEFVSNRVKYLYNVQLNRECIVRESLYYYAPNKALVFNRVTDLDKQLVDIEFGSKIDTISESRKALTGNTLPNNTVIGGFLKTNMALQELHDVASWFKSVLKPVITPETKLAAFLFKQFEEDKKKKENLLRILNKADFRVSDIQYRKDLVDVSDEVIDAISKTPLLPVPEIERIKDTGKIEVTDIMMQHTVNSENYLLPIESESAGTKRYYELAGIMAVFSGKETVIPVDEFESSLHPDLVKHFLLTFLTNSTKSQLIVTTHMRELLMEKEILRNDVIWFTEKKEDDSTDLYNLTDFGSSVVRNTSSIFKAYKFGKLGAFPNLSDYYIGMNSGE